MGEMIEIHGYSGVGLDLRSAREALGKKIADATKTLRIRAAHLEALESGRYEDLPDAVYVHGFVRSYAGFLQLDPDEMVRRAQLELQPRVVSDDLHFPAPSQNAAKPSLRLLLVALFLAAAVFAIWYLSSGVEEAAVPRGDETQAEAPLSSEAATSDPDSTGFPAAPAETSARQAGQADADPAVTAGEPQAADAPQIPPVEELVAQYPVAPEADAVAALAVLENLNPASVADELGAPEIARGVTPSSQEMQEAFKSVPPQAASSPQREAAVISPSLSSASPIPIAPLVLRATADTWMQVTNENGTLIKSWVMRAGENYVPPEESGLKVMVGNAGALVILINGEAQPSLGAKGAVIRGLPLNVAELKARFQN